MAVVTFAPINASADNVQTNNAMDDGENTLDNYDVVDEKTSLLKAEGGSIQKSRSGLGSVHQLQPPPDMEQRSSSFHTVGQTGESSMISAEATKATSRLRVVPSTQSFDEHLNKGSLISFVFFDFHHDNIDKSKEIEKISNIKYYSWYKVVLISIMFCLHMISVMT